MLLFILYIFLIIFFFNITFTGEQWEDEQGQVQPWIIKQDVNGMITLILAENCQNFVTVATDPPAKEKPVGEFFKILPKETATFYPYKD